MKLLGCGYEFAKARNSELVKLVEIALRNAES